MKGRLVIISAPAGTGKTTLVNMLKKAFPKQVVQTVSCTTRRPRPGEIDGKDYFFLTQEAFEEKIKKGDFLEYATVFGKSYGTLKETVTREQISGKDVVLVIDTQGALKLKLKLEATLIFIAPPSMDILEKRLKNRKTESSQSLKQRLKWARHEMEQMKYYDYTIINDDLKTAFKALKKIVIDRKPSKGENHGL